MRAACWALAVVFWALVAAAEPASPPNDPSFDLQWYLYNTGQTVNSQTGTIGADIDFLGAWGQFQGTGNVIVAIVGAGVDHHVEFADRLLEGFVATGAGGDPFSTLDTNDQGTHLAGIIAASANNGVGIAGIFPQVRILPVRAFTGSSGSEFSVANGIRLAVDHGASVILAAVQFFEPNFDLQSAVEYANAHNVLVVAPTGNLGTEGIAYPAGYAGCVAVGVTDSSDRLASFSSFGPGITLVAPGVDIWSTSGEDGYGFESHASGASAAAVVAGVAALIRSYAPQLSAGEVRQVLMDSAEDLGEAGWDEYFGSGRVNAAVALQFAPRPALRFEYVDEIPVFLTPQRVNTFQIRIVDGSESVISTHSRLWYRISGGSFVQTTDVRYAGGSLFAVDLPAVACGQTVEFYIAAGGSAGSTVTEPLGAPDAFYSAEAIIETELFVDDFESDRGWATSTEGALTTGSWIRAVPVGTSAQPGIDRSPDYGTTCFITGQHPGGDNPGADDVDGGPVRLLSPTIEFHDDDAAISFAVWVYSQSGTPDALTFELSLDGGATWLAVAQIGPTSGWTLRSYRLSDYLLTAGDQLKMRFSIADVPSDSLTEAAIDEVRIVGRRCGGVLGDITGDGHVTLADYLMFRPCMAGPGATPGGSGCAASDFNGSGRIDLKDWSIFQVAYEP